LREGETIATTEALDPRNVAPGIPVARPDPDKPYPEEDAETRAVHHTADVEAKTQEQAVIDKAAADKAAEAKAEADAEAKAKAKE
jgi:hypothetical protein